MKGATGAANNEEREREAKCEGGLEVGGCLLERRGWRKTTCAYIRRYAP
jgi:hypothetical protein